MPEEPCCWLATVDIFTLQTGYYMRYRDLREQIFRKKGFISEGSLKQMIQMAWDQRKNMRTLAVAIQFHERDHIGK